MAGEAPGFFADERGNIIVLFAVWLGLAASLGALAIDSASLYLERRELQATVDLAALAAVRDPARAGELARLALVDAGELASDAAGGELAADGIQRLVVETGRYRADPSVAPGERFVSGAEPADAVRVVYRRPGTLVFARWNAPPSMSASAVAAVTPRVGFSVGSRLARLEGGVANAALNRLLGTGLTLSVADYRALAAAQVRALDFLDALGAELGIAAGSYEDLLGAEARRGDVARALARLLTGSEAFVMSLIANASAPSGPFPVGRLMDLDELAGIELGARPPGLDAGISVLDLIVAAAGLGGDVQVGLDVTASVPGLAGITATLRIGEPPQGASSFVVGSGGSVARTAQVRLRLDARLLGPPLLLGAGVSLPIQVELAPASARVTAAACPTTSAPHGSATIAAVPGIVRLSVGAVDASAFADMKQALTVRPATLVAAATIGVNGSATLEAVQTTPIPLSFTSTDISSGATKTATTQSLAASLVAALVEELDISVRPGLLSSAAVRTALLSLLAPLVPALDATLVGLTDAAGLRLGEADVRVYGVTCEYPVLVG